LGVVGWGLGGGHPPPMEASLSCTGLVHACFPPFDEDRVIDQMMRRRSWPLERYVARGPPSPPPDRRPTRRPHPTGASSAIAPRDPFFNRRTPMPVSCCRPVSEPFESPTVTKIVHVGTREFFWCLGSKDQFAKDTPCRSSMTRRQSIRRALAAFTSHNLSLAASSLSDGRSGRGVGGGGGGGPVFPNPLQPILDTPPQGVSSPASLAP